MAINRRELIQTGALSVLAVPLATAKAEPVVNTGYDGPGIYLYPAWGEPRAYAVLPVMAGGAMLEFRDVSSGELRWRQTPSLDCEFAAKLAPL